MRADRLTGSEPFPPEFRGVVPRGLPEYFFEIVQRIKGFPKLFILVH